MISRGFIVSKEKEKSIGETEETERKGGRGRNSKVSPVLSPALIQPEEGISRPWGVLPDRSGGPSFKPPVSCPSADLFAFGAN